MAEASEHVLRFDWSDVAQRTRGIYRQLVGVTKEVQAMTEMLEGLMQDDFPLTLHHMLRRMRDCHPTRRW